MWRDDVAVDVKDITDLPSHHKFITATNVQVTFSPSAASASSSSQLRTHMLSSPKDASVAEADDTAECATAEMSCDKRVQRSLQRCSSAGITPFCRAVTNASDRKWVRATQLRRTWTARWCCSNDVVSVPAERQSSVTTQYNFNR